MRGQNLVIGVFLALALAISVFLQCSCAAARSATCTAWDVTRDAACTLCALPACPLQPTEGEPHGEATTPPEEP